MFALLSLCSPALLCVRTEQDGSRSAAQDEATSALDLASEAEMCSALSHRCGAVVSVGHRPTLARFHKWVLELSPQAGDGGSGSAFRLITSAQYLSEQHQRGAV